MIRRFDPRSLKAHRAVAGEAVASGGMTGVFRQTVGARHHGHAVKRFTGFMAGRAGH